MEILLKYITILYVMLLIAFLVLGFIFKTYYQFCILKSTNKSFCTYSYARFLFGLISYEYSLNVYIWIIFPFYYNIHNESIGNAETITTYKDKLVKYNRVALTYVITIPILMVMIIYFGKV